MKWPYNVLERALAFAREAEEKGWMVDGPDPSVRRYIGPGHSACEVCGRPGCHWDNRMFRACENHPPVEK